MIHSQVCVKRTNRQHVRRGEKRIKTTCGKHRSATQWTVIERAFISSEGPKFRAQMIAFHSSETRLGTRLGLPIRGSCCQWSLCNGIYTAQNRRLNPNSLWRIAECDQLIQRFTTGWYVSSDLYRQSSTINTAQPREMQKRTIHNLAVVFIRTWEVWPWHSIDFRSYFAHSEQLVAAFERTNEQLARESPQDELATFGCLRCKPALKSVSKY